MDDHLITTKNAPRLQRSVNHLSSPNCVRVYRASPECVLLQMRLKTQYVSVALTFDETQTLIDALRDAKPDHQDPLITIIHGLLAICPWRDQNGKEHEQVTMARRVAKLSAESNAA